MRKSYNKFYSFLNSNPSLVLGADKVWDNLLKSRKTDYDNVKETQHILVLEI